MERVKSSGMVRTAELFLLFEYTHQCLNADFRLLISNAKGFNEKTTHYWIQSDELQHLVRRLRKEVRGQGLCWSRPLSMRGLAPCSLFVSLVGTVFRTQQV